MREINDLLLWNGMQCNRFVLTIGNMKVTTTIDTRVNAISKGFERSDNADAILFRESGIFL